MRVDVLIIGGGVTGCAIARQLSGRAITVALSEAREDVAMGASRANSAIVHAGYDAAPGSLMASLNVRGNALYDAWCEALQVPLKRIGSLVIAFDGEDHRALERLYRQGIQNGVPGLSIVSGDEARALEPMLSPEVSAALHAKTGAITCPYELATACYENARQNGLCALVNAPVRAIARDGEGFAVQCGEQTVYARYVVNAAGLFADDIARMMGDESFDIRPRKGEYLLMDHAAARVQTVIFQTPSRMGKGVLVSPTVDGNVFVGPTARDQASRTDTDTTEAGITSLRKMALRSVPSLDFRSVITAFAGLRAQSGTDDFVIRPSEKAPHMIHVAGICSPGLTAAPAIAERVEALLEEAGLSMPEKPDFDPVRPAIARFREMTNTERAEAIRKNPRYGRVVCRCETVTEAEIVEAISRGARSLDAVKRRTRAGMGRCQGGFCAPRVMELLCRETGMAMTEITKCGGESVIAPYAREEVR